MQMITFTPPDEIAQELEQLVRRGRYRTVDEAMTEAARLLIRRDQADEAFAQIAAIRRKLEGSPAGVTRQIVAAHEEEEER